MEDVVQCEIGIGGEISYTFVGLTCRFSVWVYILNWCLGFFLKKRNIFCTNYQSCVIANLGLNFCLCM